MSKQNNERRKIFKEDLPHRGTFIDWRKCEGLLVRFIYDDIEGYIKILKYEGKYLTIKYNNNELEILSSHFSDGNFGKVITKREYLYKEGEIISTNTGKIKILDKIHIKSEKGYKYECLIDGYIGEIRERHLEEKVGCSCCSGRSIVEGINDIPTTAPFMVRYFQDGIEEAKLYTKRSMKSIYPICPDCGRIRSEKVIIDNIYRNHSIGCSCNDGKSYCEKFMFNILEQLNIDFEMEYSPDWIKPRRYDFYIPSINLIIEMDGGLGHGKVKHSKTNVSIEESKAIDDYKDEQAKLHDIEVVRIDCDYYSIENRFEFIKQNILNNDKIINYIDMNNIDFEKCNEFSLSSRIKEVCEYKNDNPNLTNITIGEIMKLHKSTIQKYLKIGSKIGWVEE